MTEVQLQEFKLDRGRPLAAGLMHAAGHAWADALTKLVALAPAPALQHRLLAVSFAAGPDDAALHSNLAGFVCVTAVDMERQTLTILSPQPRPLSDTVLLLLELQYMDNH